MAGELTRLEVIEIYNTHGPSRHIATKFGITRSTVMRIKGGWKPYTSIIMDYKKKMTLMYYMEDFGYDPDYKVFENTRIKSC